MFGHVLEAHVEAFPGVSYTAFLVPGLVMMSVLQNAFANSSSSLIQSKITGNLVFVLLPPLSHAEFFAAYVLAAVTRGLAVGLGVFAVTLWFAPGALLVPKAPLWILVFALAGSALLGILGVIAGIVSDKFDQLAAFQNFIIMPATFLSGVFYSVHGLPPFWQAVSHFNPFFYMIDGFRYGFFAQSDVSPWISLGVVGVALAVRGVDRAALARAGLQDPQLMLPTPDYVRQAIASGLSLRAPRSEWRRAALRGAHRQQRLRGQEPRRAPSARLRGARRSHEGGDSRLVDAHPDACRVRGRTMSFPVSCSLHAPIVRASGRAGTLPVDAAHGVRRADRSSPCPTMSASLDPSTCAAPSPRRFPWTN